MKVGFGEQLFQFEIPFVVSWTVPEFAFGVEVAGNNEFPKFGHKGE